MGIIVNQSETLTNGLIVNNYYVSLGRHSINIEKCIDRKKKLVESELITER